MPIISILVSMFSLDNIRKANLYVNAFTIANCICWIRKRYRMGLNNRRLGKIFRKHILVMTLVRVLLQYHVVTSASLLARSKVDAHYLWFTIVTLILHPHALTPAIKKRIKQKTVNFCIKLNPYSFF